MENTMTKVTTRTLAAAEDMRSFLVPSRGFATVEQGEAEAARFFESVNQAAERAGVHQVEPAFWGETFYHPVFSGRCSYLPRINCGEWDVQAILSGQTSSREGKPIWTRLAPHDVVKPEGSYNVALLVEGRRRYFRSQRYTRKHPKWTYRLCDGEFDCCTVWGRNDVDHLNGGIAVDDSTRIYAARSARGVIYTRRTLFDNSGQPSGFHTGFALVEFSILDRDATKDDMLRVLITSRTAISDNSEQARDPWVDDLDQGWQALVNRARTTFEATCKPVLDEVDEWRRNFIEQSEKLRRMRAMSNSAMTFFDGIRNMDWQEALQLVQEPWQLKAVIDVHCNHRFDDSPHRDDTTCSRVGRMLYQFACSDERRAELQGMVRDFVAPADELWSYSGD